MTSYTRDRDAALRHDIACGRIGKADARELARTALHMAVGFEIAGEKYEPHAVTAARFAADVLTWCQRETAEQIGMEGVSA
jgi:hypothetical protein